jgi:protein-S-isoprenylcysteine O-methyltransferase Ste14
MTYKELKEQHEYTEIASVYHSEIKTFIVAEVEKQPLWAKIANMYQITGVLAFVLGAFKAFMPYLTSFETSNLIWLGIGLLFTFSVLIVLHEFIHALAYRWVGANKISFGMELKKFLFYVQADRQVLNYKQFQIVALAPVITVGFLSMLGMVIFYNSPVFFFFLPIFAFHSLFCGGDFGLLCFFQNRPETEILTFDVKEEKKTYFYACPTKPIKNS